MEREEQTTDLKRQKGRSRRDITFMRHVANCYNQGNESLRQLSERFGLPNQTISRWALRFSPELAEQKDLIISPMTEQEQRDVAALKRQLEALKKKLEYEQMKNFALETMADLAKTELGIDIRKNFGAKPPKE